MRVARRAPDAISNQKPTAQHGTDYAKRANGVVAVPAAANDSCARCGPERRLKALSIERVLLHGRNASDDRRLGRGRTFKESIDAIYCRELALGLNNSLGVHSRLIELQFDGHRGRRVDRPRFPFVRSHQRRYLPTAAVHSVTPVGMHHPRGHRGPRTHAHAHEHEHAFLGDVLLLIAFATLLSFSVLIISLTTTRTSRTSRRACSRLSKLDADAVAIAKMA